jgi:hypothetical protein
LHYSIKNGILARETNGKYNILHARLVGFSNVILISCEFQRHTLHAKKYGPGAGPELDI